MRRRLLRGIGGNLYGQAVTVAVQIVTVPGFAQAWGSRRFGTWLMLTAASAVVAMADCGVTLTSGNAMTMAVARGDSAAAGRLSAQAFRFVWLVAAGLAGVGLLLWGVTASVAAANSDDLRAASAALGAAALVSLHLGTVDVGFRANGDYPIGLAIVGTIRLLETLAALGAALSGGGLAAAAGALLGVRLAGTLLATAALRRRAPWLCFRAPGLRWGELRPFAVPALAALAVPAGLVLGLQGMTLAAGLVVPTGAVAVFVAARTLTRTLVQGLGLFNQALMPEMAMAAGRCDARQTLALLRLNLVLGVALLVPGWAILLVWGPALMRWWTGGVLVADPLVFGLLATAALCQGAWLSIANLLLATNRHARTAGPLLAITTAACLIAVPLGAAAGLAGLAAAALAGEAAMAALILPAQIRAALGRGPALQAVGP